MKKIPTLEVEIYVINKKQFHIRKTLVWNDIKRYKITANFKNMDKLLKAKELKKKKREIANEKRQKGRIISVLVRKQTISNENRKFFSEISVQTSRESTPSSILAGLQKNERRKNNGRRYTMTTLVFAFGILSIGGITVYNFIRSNLPLPSLNTVRNHFNTYSTKIKENLVDINSIEDIILNYKKENNITGKLKVVLAVDAISFTPVVKITDQGFIHGFIKDENLNKVELRKLNEKYSQFEKYISSMHSSSVIKASFVYQVQPISPLYRWFVVHIDVSTQGKATNYQVELLKKIKKYFEINEVEVVSYSFDGDTTYMKLHRKYNSFNDNIMKKSNITGIISDPLIYWNVGDIDW